MIIKASTVGTKTVRLIKGANNYFITIGNRHVSKKFTNAGDAIAAHKSMVSSYIGYQPLCKIAKIQEA